MRNFKLLMLGLVTFLVIVMVQAMPLRAETPWTPAGLTPLPLPEVVQLLEKTDRATQKATLPQEFRRDLEKQVRENFKTARVIKEVFPRYNPSHGVFALVIRFNTSNGGHLLVTFLYTGVAAADKHLGTFVFETGSPGKAYLHLLQKGYPIQIGVQQAGESLWRRQNITTNSIIKFWEIPYQGEGVPKRAFLWFKRVMNQAETTN